MYEDAILSPGWLAGRAAQEWSLWATVRSCASLSTTWCVVSVMSPFGHQGNWEESPARLAAAAHFEQQRVNLRGQSLM